VRFITVEEYVIKMKRDVKVNCFHFHRDCE
jgi:hypothetical protein